MLPTNAVTNSDIVDGPLVGSSSSSPSLIRRLPNPNFGTLLSYLKNMVVRSPDSLVKQAKTIIDGGMDPFESGKTTASISENKTEASFTVDDLKLQERRPGLSLKRAKFSVKPMPSQPDVSVEPGIDIDKFKDPVEFFAALDGTENGKREFRRQKGQRSEEMDQKRASLLPRRHRPSLLGQSDTYKRRSYSLTGIPDDDEALISSQEADGLHFMSPTHDDVIPETTPMNFSPQTSVSDVKSANTAKVSELDELLSCDFKGLDEDGIQNLLLDKLNIKLVDICQPSLPHMPDFRRQEALSNMKDSIFHINDSCKAASRKSLNFSYQFKKGSKNQVSPSLCKSPLASVSTLNKHISRLTPQKDPFSPTNIDSSTEAISYSQAQKKQDSQIEKRIDSHEFSRFHVNVEEANEAVSSPGLEESGRIPDIESEEQVDGVGHCDQSVTNEVSPELVRSPTCGIDLGVSGENLPSATVKNTAASHDPEEWMDEIRQTAPASTSENLFEIRFPTDGEDNLAILCEASLGSAGKDVDATSVPMEEDQIALGQESVDKEVFSEGSALEKASATRGDGEMGKHLNTLGIMIEKPNKKKAGSFKGKRKETDEPTALHQENIYEEPLKKGRKGKSRSYAAVSKEPRNTRRKVESATSLLSKFDEQLGADTKLAAGPRRSTRIRMRPLEFWKGERFLYGRVDESMVSVIGVKYASPTQNGEEPTMKVNSFVSEEYKDLLDLASYH